MILILFLNGLAFWGLGLASYLQFRQGSDLPLNKHLIWLAAFGFVCGTTSWLDMFIASGGTQEYLHVLGILKMLTQPLTGILLLKFGWDILRDIPLPSWTIFIPGILIVPVALVVTYAATTFSTPSPIEIPIDIWSRYLLYLPGAILAGIGFLRLGNAQRKSGFTDVANLLFGAGLAFLFEAFIVGLVVPAAPYGPASYYNYDRVLTNAFTGVPGENMFSGFTAWLDYAHVLVVTGLPIEFWRMLSAFAVTFFVVRGLGVFDTIRKRQLGELQEQRDRAQAESLNIQIVARQTAEQWTDVLMSINRQIMEMEDVDQILFYIVKNARELLPADFVGLALLEDNPSSLELKCFSTEGKTEIVESLIGVHTPILQEILLTTHSYRSSGKETSEQIENITCNLVEQVNGFGIVRQELENHPIGILWATRSDELQFSDTDLVWLECMADQVVIAIQHGLMTSQIQSLSITEERARIARDMHDGLAQVLGYLNLEVQTLGALHKQGKNKALSIELEKMRSAILVANADVRENILSLRTTLANGKGLVSAIGEYLDEFSIQTGIETRFSTDGNEKLDLSSIAEVQLVCILQEALANVRKHAHAQKVEVFLLRKKESGKEWISLQVIDDGIGLTGQRSKHSFGLNTMQERANSVGGALELKSPPGKGTAVVCRLPCLQTERLKESQIISAKNGKFVLHDSGTLE
ncbi:MAG: GAF domain-containing sensor histidine kinase [Anaerolineales bacterium]|jgi:signal transduction histidine kinase